MELKKAWEAYREEDNFHYDFLPDLLKQRGERIVFEPKTMIVSRGEFPDSIYFIRSGTVAGIREYSDGNEYSYFRLNQKNGSIGILEVLARKEQYIATIVSVTKVTAIRVDAADVYRAIMTNVSLLRRCTALLAQDLYQRSGNDGILYYLQGIDRVRFYLVTYYEENQGREKDETETVTVQAEYQEIASRIGVSVRTVGRNIRKLKETDEIVSCKKKIQISYEQYKRMMENIYM